MSNYVSYAWFTSRQSGFGGIEINNPENIKDIHDVKGISKWLGDEVVKDEYGEKASCVVLSFQKYQESRPNKEAARPRMAKMFFRVLSYGKKE